MNINPALFHFLRPEWLLAVPVLLFLSFLLWRSHARQSSWRRVVDPALLPYLLQDGASQRRRWPVYLFTFCGILACIAMAGPTWKQLPQPIFRNDAALVIVLDLSRSMDAQDIKPSRLQRARFKIADILRARKDGQTALLVYAADAFVVTPLTDDDETISSQLSALTTSLVPAQGSRTDIALQMAVQLLKQASQTQGQVLLITDEVKTVRGIEAAKELTDAGYSLSILGVGTTTGAPIPEHGSMLKNQQGEIIIPKLDPENLQRIATAGNGKYISITSNDRDIRYLDITDTTVSDDATSESENLTTDRWHEAGPWFLLPLLLLAPLAFRRGIFILACVMLLPVPQPAQAFEWQDLWQTPDQRAQQLFQQDKAADAAQQFNDPAWRASANFQSENYEQALKDFQSVDGADARYNEGNTLAKMGKLEEAIKAYDQAIKQQANHEDAIHNRKLVEEQLKKQQQDQQSQDQQSQDQQSQDQQSQDQQAQDQQAQDQQSQDQQSQDQQAQDQQSQDQQAQDQQAQDQQSQDQQSQDQQAQDQQAQDQQAQDQQAQDQQAQDQQAQDQQAQDQQAQDQQAQDQQAQEDIQLTQEEKMSQEQWLNRIPDDPAGLLRRKFEYQYRQRARASDGEQQW